MIFDDSKKTQLRAELFQHNGKEIYLIGINFSGKTKSVKELLTEKL